MNTINRFYRLIRKNPVVTFGIGVLSALLAEKGTDQIFNDLGILKGTAIIAVLLIVSAFLFDMIVRWWAWMRYVPPIHRGSPPDQHRGLIALFSRPETLRKAVAHHVDRLESLWLVVTPQTESSAREVETEFPSLQIFQEEISNPWRAWEASGAIRRAHAQALDLGYEPSELIVDLTGGTTAMTVGAASACRDLGLAMEMVPGQYNDVLNVQRPLEVLELGVENPSIENPTV